MFLQKLPSCKKKPRSCSEKNPEKSSKDIMSNAKEATSEADMKGVTSDPKQDQTESSEVKIPQARSSDCINATA